MRRILLFIACCLTIVESQAQQTLNRKYNNVSLSEALRQLNAEATDYEINFLYNELEDFRITTVVRRKTIPEAIRQMIGFYPIRMSIDSAEITIECPQKNAPRYKGIIIDEQGQPVVYANIALLSSHDSTLITGGVSNESGLFVIPCERSQANDKEVRKPILARFSHIGYRTIYMQCNNTELGTIQMQPETQKLRGVTVKGQIPLLRYEAGTIIFDTRHIAGAVNATDLLRYSPGILLNDEDMTLFGTGGVVICINGREQRMEQREMLQMLRSVPASDVEKIEIIRAPGAMYSAEGNAGVVNLVLKKKDNDYVGGALGYAHTQYEEHGNEATANVVYNRGSVSTSLNIAGTWDNTRYLETNEIRFTDTFRHGSDKGQIRKENYSLRWQMDCKASDRLDLGAYVWWADGSRRLSVDGCYDYLPKNNSLSSSFPTQTSRKEDTKTRAVNVNASQSLGSRDAKADFNLDYYRMRMGDGRHSSFGYLTYIENLPVDTNQKDTPYFIYKNHIAMDVDNYSAKADIAFAGLKFGMQCAYTRSHRDLGYSGVGNYTLVANTYDEQLLTGYMEYGRIFGNSWYTDVGGRYEHIWTKVVNQPMANASRKSYGKLFPALHIAFKPNPAHAFDWTLSSRITRPNIININSDWVWKDVNHVSYGNQKLKPSYLYKAMMGYSYKGVLSFDLYYSYELGRIDAVYLVDKQVTYNSWDNSTDQYDFGIHSSYRFDKLSWMTATLTHGVGYSKTVRNWGKGILETPTLYLHGYSRVESISYSGLLQAFFFLDSSHKCVANFNMTYNSPEKDVTRSLKARYTVDAGLQYRFWRDRMTLDLTCRNLISSRNKGTEYLGATAMHFDNKYDYRQLRLTLTYNWGARLQHHQHRYESDKMQERIVNDF